MSRKKNTINIPVIKHGKDICRLIFQKAEDCKYDIKLEFRGNPYQVCTYRLFSLSPIIWNVEHPQRVNMSYHHGAHEYPVLIHLKDEEKGGKEKYRTLPATRIQAPNTNQLFPIPLLKMEIPERVVSQAPEYKEKPYHHKLQVDAANVIEIYMASDEFDVNRYFSNAYGTLLIPQMVLSMEYFATCSVVSDYSKNEHFMPGGEPAERFRCLGGIPGMQLFVVMYDVPDFDNAWKNIRVTFIENELSEEILLCTKVSYPEVNLVENEYDCIFLGGPTLDQLRPPAGPLSKIPVMCNTTVLRSLKAKDISEEERNHLEMLAGRARMTLYKEMKSFEEKLEIQKQEYLRKARAFLEGVELLQLPEAEGIAEELHLLFARFCGLEQVSILRMVIRGEKKIRISHPWLVLDDMLSVDLLRGKLNLFLEDKEYPVEPDISVFRSRPYFCDDGWDGMRHKLNAAGYICEGPQYRHYDEAALKDLYARNNGKLEKIYQMILLLVKE